MRGRSRRPAAWAGELKRAIAEAGEHLSLYQLTIEQDTPFFALHAAGKLIVPDEDTARALYDPRRRPARRPACPPTRFRTMRGPAPSAGTTWSIGAGTNMPASAPAPMAGSISTASAKPPRPRSGRRPGSCGSKRGHGVVTDEMLTPGEQADEFLLMGLRLAEGIDPARYARFPAALDPRASRSCATGRRRDHRKRMLRVTLAGFPVLDAVVADLAASFAANLSHNRGSLFKLGWNFSSLRNEPIPGRLRRPRVFRLVPLFLTGRLAA